MAGLGAAPVLRFQGESYGSSSFRFKLGLGTRQKGSLPVTCAKSRRATCPKPTRCGQASASLCSGSKERVRVMLELWFWVITTL